jgi:hypothetical protein
MKNKPQPKLFDPEYLLSTLVDILKNDPKSAHLLLEQLMNVNYDFSTNNGYYKLLNPQQRDLLTQIHLRRKQAPDFDAKFRYYILIAAGIVGLGFGAVKLVEKLSE